MIKNFLKVAVRNLLRNKGFSALNIAGLSIGMAGAILILLWIQNEVSYDRFHANGPQLYEAWNRGKANDRLECWPSTPRMLGPTLQMENADIANTARTINRWFVTTAGESKMSSQAILADPSFLQMFSFPLIHGNAKTALSGITNMVVTEKMAKKMFGSTDVLGKVIRIDHDNFTVTGVMKDLPVNTGFDFEYILPWQYCVKIDGEYTDWGNNSCETFVQLAPNANPDAVGKRIVTVSKKHSNGDVKEEIFLHPINKWRLYSNFENGKVSGGRITVVITFGIIAAFILLIACINFMNLSTARSEKRSKEVGIRKVVGAGRSSLIAQFLGESILLSFLSAALALLLVQLCLPLFQTLTGKAVTVPYGNVYFWLAALAFVLFSGTLAGSYPALFLSSFQPVTVLKGTFKKANAVINPRKILVVLQFSFAIVLIVCTIVVVQQTRYAQARETGYDRSQLMYHFLTGSLRENFPMVKRELLASGAATDLTKTNSPLTEVWSDTWSVEWQGKQPGDKTIFDVYAEDEGLVKTAGLKLVNGRDMNLAEFPTDSTAALLNESAVKAMNFKQPIGQSIRNDGKTWHVIGVVKDFVMRSPFERTFPLVVFGGKADLNLVTMKLNARNTTADNMRTVAKIFKTYNPEFPFEYHFINEQYALKFEDTQRTATLIGVFATLTIIISCLGLFGLAAYMAENRIKEIGVRKVLGASVAGIVTLLSKDFLQLVIISLFIGSPVAWFLMHTWLQDVPYHIGMSWSVFAITAALSIFIAVITVSFQAIKAAIENPIKSLRTE